MKLLLTCFKCHQETAVLTYEENRTYSVHCPCGCEYTFEHCSMDAAEHYHNREVELHGEIDRNRELTAQIAAYISLGTLDELTALVQAKREGRLVELPLVAMVEQSMQDGKMKPQKDQKFNGRYAVVYKSERWGCPLIDICGAHYNPEQAEARRAELTHPEAKAALAAQEGGSHETDSV